MIISIVEPCQEGNLICVPDYRKPHGYVASKLSTCMPTKLNEDISLLVVHETSNLKIAPHDKSLQLISNQDRTTDHNVPTTG
jgi:hypothetical protein